MPWHMWHTPQVRPCPIVYTPCRHRCHLLQFSLHSSVPRMMGSLHCRSLHYFPMLMWLRMLVTYLNKIPILFLFSRAQCRAQMRWLISKLASDSSSVVYWGHKKMFFFGLICLSAELRWLFERKVGKGRWEEAQVLWDRWEGTRGENLGSAVNELLCSTTAENSLPETTQSLTMLIHHCTPILPSLPLKLILFSYLPSKMCTSQVTIVFLCHFLYIYDKMLWTYPSIFPNFVSKSIVLLH